MEIEIEIKNQEQQLAHLRSECVTKALELSDLNSSYSKVLEDISTIEQEKKEFAEKCDEERLKLNEEYDRITAGRKSLVELKESTDKELTVIRNEIKTANKELSLANDRVLKARDELESVTKKKEELEVKASEFEPFVEKTLKLTKYIETLEEKKSKLSIEIHQMLEESTRELLEAKNELKKISIDVLMKTEQANHAQYETKKYLDELNIHMNNYNIVHARLETVFKKQFPELELKI